MSSFSLMFASTYGYSTSPFAEISSFLLVRTEFEITMFACIRRKTLLFLQKMLAWGRSAPNGPVRTYFREAVSNEHVSLKKKKVNWPP